MDKGFSEILRDYISAHILKYDSFFSIKRLPAILKNDKPVSRCFTNGGGGGATLNGPNGGGGGLFKKIISNYKKR